MSTSGLSIAYAVERLEAQATIILALVSGVSDEQARWKPTPDEWSMLEVINHLNDEEREDFRMRFDLTLHRPDADWPPIDPQGWVAERHYNACDVAGSVQAFLGERERSLAWLRSLGPVNLHSAHHHPHFGSMEAGVLLASWIAHDCLHIRQLDDLHYRYLAQVAQPFSVEYAGDW